MTLASQKHFAIYRLWLRISPNRYFWFCKPYSIHHHQLILHLKLISKRTKIICRLWWAAWDSQRMTSNFQNGATMGTAMIRWEGCMIQTGTCGRNGWDGKELELETTPHTSTLTSKWIPSSKFQLSLCWCKRPLWKGLMGCTYVLILILKCQFDKQYVYICVYYYRALVIFSLVYGGEMSIASGFLNIMRNGSIDDLFCIDVLFDFDFDLFGRFLLDLLMFYY